MAAPKPQDLLAPYIAGDYVRENGDVDAHCPLHEDRRRSAVFNFDEGVWYCNTEGIGGNIEDLIERRDEWVAPPDGEYGDAEPKRRKRPAEQLPSDAAVAGWNVALMGDSIAMDDLKATRGLWTKTVDHFELGWDRSKSVYTIPVRDSAGKLVNVRRYALRVPEGRRKIWGITGHNGPILYPWSALNKAKAKGEPIIICEGELDALITNQYGFRAVTRTSAAKTWRVEWSKHFKGLTVYVCHDMDDAGQSANRKVARSLLRAGVKDVRVVRLPYAVTAKGGKDLTDWWMDHDGEREAFRRLLEEAQPFDEAMGDEPEDISPDSASVVDAFDSRRTGRPLALTVTVKGRREPGYSVPRKVQFRCTQDYGKACAVCPMNAEGGAMDHVVAGADPAILEMMDATKQQLATTLRAIKGIPKCPKLNIKVAEHQAVEVLFARPSVEHANGGGSADYKNIKLTSVGRHDTATNQTVRVVGALHPDPRRQINEFLTWDVSRLETSIDRFDMDADTYDLLKQFRPAPGQSPLKKVRDIADDLAAHVTHIYGRPELHAAMDLVFHSAVAFEFGGKLLARGWMELIVVGDTRTGKSEVATRLTQFYGAGEVVSCESASLAGILGGLQQFGANKEWAITWGSIPINDRRLVVLDEVSGLPEEHIGQLSSVRSSGIAELTKIQQERTYARTRLIWLGNPRGGGRMSDYVEGVQALKPLIGNPEDIARFDLAMSVASGDVPTDAINRGYQAGPQVYDRDACRTLLRWAWSRTAEHIVFADGAEEAIYAAALDMGKRYVEDPPLVQAANVREKIARLAVALAVRTFSTDERGEDVIVQPRHVKSAVQLIDHLYNMQGFGYGARSREVIERQRDAERPETIEKARKVLLNYPGLDVFLRSSGKFRRQDLEEVLDVDREEANAIISSLYQLNMIWKDKGDVRLTSTLNRLLREARR